MKIHKDNSTIDISLVIKKMDEIDNHLKIKLLETDLKYERMTVSYYKELINNIMRYELENCCF